MNFTTFMKLQGITLLPWQARAAYAVLEHLHAHQEPGEGKSFLLTNLWEFENEHGDNFELDGGVINKGESTKENLAPAPSDTIVIHKLKTWPEFFNPTAQLQKTFEFRRNDRDFQVGDLLWLQEWNRGSETYTGRSCLRAITYIISPMWGPAITDLPVKEQIETLTNQHCILGIDRIPRSLQTMILSGIGRINVNIKPPFAKRPTITE